MIALKNANVLKFGAVILVLSVIIAVTSCDMPTTTDQGSVLQETRFQTSGGTEGLERQIIWLKPGQAQVAIDAADEIYRIVELEDRGTVVFGRLSFHAIETLAKNPKVRFIKHVNLYGIQGHKKERGGVNKEVFPWGIARVEPEH